MHRSQWQVGLMAVGLLVSFASRAWPEEPHLELRWETVLGSGEVATYRTAVCADGRSHLINSNGRLISLDPNGEVIADRRHGELRGIHAVACADSGVYAVTSGRGAGPGLVHVSHTDSVVRVALSTTEAIPAMVWAGSHGLLSVLLHPKEYLVKISSEGESGGRFGAIPDRPEALGLKADQITGSRVLWDSRNGRFLFLPSFPPTIEIFSERGEFLGRRSPALRNATDESPAKEEVAGAALLPNGDLLLQIRRTYPAGERVIRQTAEFALVDGKSAFNRVSARIPMSPDGSGVSGVLAGGDTAGGLYFQGARARRDAASRISHVSLRIKKATLVQ